MTKKEPVLCYVSGPWAYFTTQPLNEQWGDDWNDAPYEHNAGKPYEHWEDSGKKPWEIVVVAWSGSFATPCEDFPNSPYSVEAINKKAIPWLRPDVWGEQHGISIFAGTPLSEFIAKVKEAGGKVYVEVDEP